MVHKPPRKKRFNLSRTRTIITWLSIALPPPVASLQTCHLVGPFHSASNYPHAHSCVTPLLFQTPDFVNAAAFRSLSSSRRICRLSGRHPPIKSRSVSVRTHISSTLSYKFVYFTDQSLQSVFREQSLTRPSHSHRDHEKKTLITKTKSASKHCVNTTCCVILVHPMLLALHEFVPGYQTYCKYDTFTTCFSFSTNF